ncbi:hypothetical protein LguiA_022708 [Lonicera macranthoides]
MGSLELEGTNESPPQHVLSENSSKSGSELEDILSNKNAGTFERLLPATFIELKLLFKLAAPTVISYMINYLMIMVTIIFVGHLGKTELAAASLGNNGIQSFAYGLLVYAIRNASTDHGLFADVVVTDEGAQFPVVIDKGESSFGHSVDKGKSRVFTMELRLCFPDRPMTVEDSAIHDLEVVRARIMYMALPKDRKLLQHEVDERSSNYNEALAESAREVLKLKDIIYQGGYKLGLSNTGIPPDHEFFDRPVLCPPNLYTAEVSLDSEEDDEAAPNSLPSKA